MERSLELLRAAKNEINFIRKQNELMKARLDMFDSVVNLLQTNITRPLQGMAIDLCAEIEMYLSDNSNEDKPSIK